MVAKPKIKLKLDTQKIKQFFVHHAEKLVLGIFGLLFLLLAYKSFGLPRVTKTPQDLRSAVQMASAKLQNARFDAKEAGIEVKDYSEQAKEVTQKIAIDGFVWDPVRPPVWPPGNKRGRPEILAIEDIKVFSGLGVFDLRGDNQVAMANPRRANGDDEKPLGDQDKKEESQKGDGDKKRQRNKREENEDHGASTMGGNLLGRPSGMGASGGQDQSLRYAVVLGLVPIDRQTKIFEETFQNVALPRESDGEPHYVRGWVQRAEVVPGVADDKLEWKYIDAPPRRGEVSENAKLKRRLGNSNEEFAAANVVDKELTEPLPHLISGQWEPSLVVHEKLPSRPKGQTMAPGGLGQGLAPRQQRDEPVVSDSDPLAEPAAEPDRPAAPAAPEPSTKDEHSPYLLFRYFDFTVKPGKSYKYRVVLTLENPNQDVEAEHLENPDDAKVTVLRSPPSSDAVTTVPYDGNLYAGDYVVPGGDGEVAASVAVDQWIPGGARAEQIVPKVYRGRLANFEIDEPVVVDLSKNEPKAGEKDELVRVRTEVAVLDMRTDGKSRGADLLVLEPSGRLGVRKAESEHSRFDEIAHHVRDVKQKIANDKKKPKSSADQLGGANNLRVGGKTGRRSRNQNGDEMTSGGLGTSLPQN